jgi:phosphoglycolate phosphatase-like HAD superfamily hydrolase
MQVALALDFDGVVCNSVSECLSTSYSAFREFSEDVPEECPSHWRALFLERRGFVRPSGNYLLLWQWISGSAASSYDQEEFEHLAIGQQERVAAFERRFHQIRDAVTARSPGCFIRSNALYPGVIETWPAIRRFPLFIVSTKDEASIRLILSAARLSVDGVFGRGSGTKATALAVIALRCGIPMHQVAFVDDNAAHVADTSAAGACAALARWGYGPRQPRPRIELDCFREVPDFVRRLANI